MEQTRQATPTLPLRNANTNLVMRFHYHQPMERNTRQRSAIREAIAQAERPLLPQEVLDAAQLQVPGLGIATVYRNLKALVEEGELQPVNLPGENPRFEAAGHSHHHHFQCNQCQKVFDVHACPGDLSRLAPQGFTVEDHDLTLYGRCSACGPARPAARAAQRHRHA
jgi:Fur family transcriptional regulator, ferric uptake regulator